eukprot:m.11494 g.11494  ORF g.11494 m.11494 type:complete len:1353 (-) comp2635_c0_seq1:40-4098(-)
MEVAKERKRRRDKETDDDDEFVVEEEDDVEEAETDPDDDEEDESAEEDDRPSRGRGRRTSKKLSLTIPVPRKKDEEKLRFSKFDVLDMRAEDTELPEGGAFPEPQPLSWLSSYPEGPALVGDALALLEFFEHFGHLMEEQTAYSRADLETVLFGKDEAALKEAAGMFASLLRIVFRDDIDQKVAITEWMTRLPLTNPPVDSTFQSLARLFVEAHLTDMSGWTQVLEEFRQRDYCDISATAKMRVLSFLRDQAASSLFVRLHVDRAFDRAETYTKLIAGVDRIRAEVPYAEVVSTAALCLMAANVMLHCTDEGRPRIEIFMELPTRAELPAYYSVIKKPIDVVTILTRIVDGHYGAFADFLADVDLMITNAHEFNDPTSQIGVDAKEIGESIKEMRVSLKAFAETFERPVEKKPRGKKQRALDLIIEESGSATPDAGGSTNNTQTEGGTPVPAPAEPPSAAKVFEDFVQTHLSLIDDLHMRYDQAIRMVRGEMLGTDRFGNRYYAFDVWPGIVVERHQPMIYVPQRLRLRIPVPPGPDSEAPMEAGDAGDENTQDGLAAGPAPLPAAPVSMEVESAPVEALAPVELEGPIAANNHITAPWMVYTDPAHIAQLLAVLHSTGMRESVLYESLRVRRLSLLRSINSASNPASPVPRLPGDFKGAFVQKIIAQLVGLDELLVSRHFLVETTPPRDRAAWLETVRSAKTAEELKAPLQALCSIIDIEFLRSKWVTGSMQGDATLAASQSASDVAVHVAAVAATVRWKKLSNAEQAREAKKDKEKPKAAAPTGQAPQPPDCFVCQDGGELLCCDSCSRVYHLKCLTPPLYGVPDSPWKCPQCTTTNTEMAVPATLPRDYDKCRACHQEGELLWCDCCPNSYHLHCLTPPLERAPDGEWLCADCTQPREVVWLQTKPTQFWPARVLEKQPQQWMLQLFSLHDRRWVSLGALSPFELKEREIPYMITTTNDEMYKTALNEVQTYIRHQRKAAGIPEEGLPQDGATQAAGIVKQEQGDAQSNSLEGLGSVDAGTAGAVGGSLVGGGAPVIKSEDSAQLSGGAPDSKPMETSSGDASQTAAGLDGAAPISDPAAAPSSAPNGAPNANGAANGGENANGAANSAPNGGENGDAANQPGPYSTIEISAYGTNMARALYAMAQRLAMPPLALAAQLTANTVELPPAYLRVPTIRLVDNNEAFLAAPALAHALNVPPPVPYVPGAPPSAPPPVLDNRCRLMGCRNIDNPFHECSRFCAAALACPNRFNPYHWCTVWCQRWLPTPTIPARIKKPLIGSAPRQDRNKVFIPEETRRSGRQVSRRTYTEDEYEWLDRLGDDESATAPGTPTKQKARIVITQTKAQRARNM